MKKITRVGWTWKNDDPRIEVKTDTYDNGEFEIVGIFNERGSRDTWPDIDWPPRKIRITVEEIDA